MTAQTERRERDGHAGSQASSARIRHPSSNTDWKPAHARNGSRGGKDFPAAASAPSYALAGSIHGRAIGDNVNNGDGDDDGSDEDDGGSNDDVLAIKMADAKPWARRPRSRNPWAATILVLLTTLVGIALLATILSSSITRQLDPKGCRMSYMSPRYIHLSDFDTEHTRFASKYSLYLYREGGVNEDPMVSALGSPFPSCAMLNSPGLGDTRSFCSWKRR